MKNFIVEYELPFIHLVRVGIQAADEAAAIELARDAFSKGTFWDNSRDMPLLYDDFEEDDSSPLDEPVEFKAEACKVWPVPEACVKTIERNAAARRACEWLIHAHESTGTDAARKSLMQAAIQEAFLAMPHLDDLDAPDRADASYARLPAVVIMVEGGLVRSVHTTHATRCLVLDLDVDSGHGLEKVTLPAGNTVDVYSSAPYMADELPAWVMQMMKQFDAVN
jgi:hypothetical protein